MFRFRQNRKCQAAWNEIGRKEFACCVTTTLFPRTKTCAARCRFIRFDYFHGPSGKLSRPVPSPLTALR
jgi:hypothetical protein